MSSNLTLEEVRAARVARFTNPVPRPVSSLSAASGKTKRGGHRGEGESIDPEQAEHDETSLQRSRVSLSGEDVIIIGNAVRLRSFSSSSDPSLTSLSRPGSALVGIAEVIDVDDLTGEGAEVFDLTGDSPVDFLVGGGEAIPSSLSSSTSHSSPAITVTEQEAEDFSDACSDDVDGGAVDVPVPPESSSSTKRLSQVLTVVCPLSTRGPFPDVEWLNAELEKNHPFCVALARNWEMFVNLPEAERFRRGLLPERAVGGVLYGVQHFPGVTDAFPFEGEAFKKQTSDILSDVKNNDVTVVNIVVLNLSAMCHKNGSSWTMDALLGGARARVAHEQRDDVAEAADVQNSQRTKRRRIAVVIFEGCWIFFVITIRGVKQILAMYHLAPLRLYFLLGMVRTAAVIKKFVEDLQSLGAQVNINGTVVRSTVENIGPPLMGELPRLIPGHTKLDLHIFAWLFQGKDYYTRRFAELFSVPFEEVAAEFKRVNMGGGAGSGRGRVGQSLYSVSSAKVDRVKEDLKNARKLLVALRGSLFGTERPRDGKSYPGSFPSHAIINSGVVAAKLLVTA